jgi:hypothetical protein
MCPICFASTALLVASATSGGGVTALVATKFFNGRKQRKPKEQKYEHITNKNGSRSRVGS